MTEWDDYMRRQDADPDLIRMRDPAKAPAGARRTASSLKVDKFRRAVKFVENEALMLGQRDRSLLIGMALVALDSAAITTILDILERPDA